MHYYVHHESCCIWLQHEDLLSSDGLVEEIERRDYCQLVDAGYTETNVSLIIAGSRTFTDLEYLWSELDEFIVGKQVTFGISGMARGVDTAGYEWMLARGIEALKYPVQPWEWEKYGKSAGMKRNRIMARLGTHLFVRWDMVSRGTSNMIEETENMGLMVEVRRFL